MDELRIDGLVHSAATAPRTEEAPSSVNDVAKAVCQLAAAALDSTIHPRGGLLVSTVPSGPFGPFSRVQPGPVERQICPAPLTTRTTLSPTSIAPQFKFRSGDLLATPITVKEE